MRSFGLRDVSWSNPAGVENEDALLGGVVEGSGGGPPGWALSLAPSFSFGTLAGLFHSLDLSFFIFR